MTVGRAGDEQAGLLERGVQALFPETCSTAVSRIGDVCRRRLPDEEWSSVSGASQKRKDEFTAGRVVARSALSVLGYDDVVLPKGPSGETQWPEGVVGSLSHADEWSAAVTARRQDVLGVGLDIERTDRMTEAVARRIMRDKEELHLQEVSLDILKGGAMIFSAKEAVYKALFPVCQKFIGFQEAALRLREEREGIWHFTTQLFHEGADVNEAAERLVGRIVFCGCWVVAGVTYTINK